jgi:RimJ/RimL family protein N-acetyltransferase
MTEPDLSLKVAWYNDPEVNQTLILDEALQLDKTLAWFQSIQDSDTRLDLTIESSNGEPIGMIGLVQIDPHHGTAEVFIVIGNKDYWGKGVMLEAESLLMEYAFNQRHIEKIWAHVKTNNIASVITMKKLGFQIEGTLRQHVCLSGRREDIFVCGLLKEEFKPAH